MLILCGNYAHYFDRVSKKVLGSFAFGGLVSSVAFSFEHDEIFVCSGYKRGAKIRGYVLSDNFKSKFFEKELEFSTTLEYVLCGRSRALKTPFSFFEIDYDDSGAEGSLCGRRMKEWRFSEDAEAPKIDQIRQYFNFVKKAQNSESMEIGGSGGVGDGAGGVNGGEMANPSAVVINEEVPEDLSLYRDSLASSVVQSIARQYQGEEIHEEALSKYLIALLHIDPIFCIKIDILKIFNILERKDLLQYIFRTGILGFAQFYLDEYEQKNGKVRGGRFGNGALKKVIPRTQANDKNCVLI